MAESNEEFIRRLTTVENGLTTVKSSLVELGKAERASSDIINDLIVETRLLVQATSSMQKTLEQHGDIRAAVTSVEHRLTSNIREVDFKYSTKVQDLSEEISKNRDLRNGVQRIIWAVILGGVSLGLAAIAGGG